MQKLFLLLILIFISGCTTGNIILEEKQGPFKVIKVVDGDTLDLNNSMRLRLSAINTPEVGECYYQEAKDKLSSLVLNKDVYIEKDISDMDKYGRYLRYVYLNSIPVNKYLVQEGYAKVFDKYKDDTSKHAEFKEVEKLANQSKLGVWSCTDNKQDCLYVGSKNSKTYHKPDCRFAKKILPTNLVCYKTEAEIKELTKCGSCF